MIQKYPDNALPRMCEAVVALLDREDEVKKFFAEHRVRLGGKIIDQHLERLASRSDSAIAKAKTCSNAQGMNRGGETR